MGKVVFLRLVFVVNSSEPALAHGIQQVDVAKSRAATLAISLGEEANGGEVPPAASFTDVAYRSAKHSEDLPGEVLSLDYFCKLWLCQLVLKVCGPAKRQKPCFALDGVGWTGFSRLAASQSPYRVSGVFVSLLQPSH